MTILEAQLDPYILVVAISPTGLRAIQPLYKACTKPSWSPWGPQADHPDGQLDGLAVSWMLLDGFILVLY